MYVTIHKFYHLRIFFKYLTLEITIIQDRITKLIEKTEFQNFRIKNEQYNISYKS